MTDELDVKDVKDIETETQTETKDFLDQEVDIPLVGTYVKRLDYAGKEFKIKINDLKPNPTFEKVLDLQIEMDGDIRLLGIRPKNQAELKNLFGSRYRNWIDKSCKLIFSEVQEFDTGSGVEIKFTS